MSDLTSSEIVQAWKDEEFFASLTPEQQAQVPEVPSELAEMSDEELEMVAGGRKGICIFSTCRDVTCTGTTNVSPADPAPVDIA